MEVTAFETKASIVNGKVVKSFCVPKSAEEAIHETAVFLPIDGQYFKCHFMVDSDQELAHAKHIELVVGIATGKIAFLAEASLRKKIQEATKEEKK